MNIGKKCNGQKEASIVIKEEKPKARLNASPNKIEQMGCLCVSRPFGAIPLAIGFSININIPTIIPPDSESILRK